MSKKLDDLIIGLQLQAKAFEQGLNTVKKQLNKHSNDVRQTSKGYDELALSAGYAFTRIASAVQNGIAVYNEYRAAAVGLKSIVEGTGNSFSKAQGFIDSYTNDGLIPAANAATALKNLLNRGYTQTQAEDVLRRLKDSASFGRQAALSLGEAVQSASEGLKNENSILVDNAGVTKNVSVMWKEYAQSVGKGVDSLSASEKIQAEYNGIMKETQNMVGDSAKLSEELAGAQSRSAKATRDMAAAYGESLAPSMQPLLNLFTGIISGVTSFMKAAPGLSAAVTTVGTVFLGLITIFTAVGSAIAVLRPALAALNTSFMGLLMNPVVLGLTAIAGVAALVATEMAKAKKAQDEYNETIKEHNRLVQEGIDITQVAQQQEQIGKIKELISAMEKLSAAQKRINELMSDEAVVGSSGPNAEEIRNTTFSIKEYKNEVEKLQKELKLQGATENQLKKILEEKNKLVKEAQKISFEEYNNQAKTTAEKYRNVQATQQLIDAYKTAKKGSSEYKDAEKKLADMYPQFSTAAGIKIDAIQRVINKDNDAVESEWNNMQTSIKAQQQELKAALAVKEAKISALEATAAAYDAESANNAAAAKKVQILINQINAIKGAIDKDKASISDLDDLLSTPIDEITGVDPLDTEAVKTYENTELNSALKVLDHKKRMNQLSLEDEVKTLDEISKAYVKTADERMDIDERIYDARQAIIERDRKSEEEALAASEEAIQKRTQASLDWIESKKSLNELSVQEEIAAYDRIIAYSKEYLNKLLSGKKNLSEQEQAIRDDEEKQIREFEQRKYAIAKSYQDQLKQSTVEDINNLTDGIESALRKRYEKERDLREQALEEERNDLDEWRDAELDRIDTVYDARIKAIEDAKEAQVEAIQAEIDALDQQVEEKDHSETDASELQRINALKEQIQYEHDERNKLALQKELDKLIKEREDRLFKEGIEDQKDALKQKIEDLEDNADQQKDLLEQQKEDEIARIQALYDAEKKSIDDRMSSWKAYYDQRLSDANLQAEAEKMIVQNNQNDIIALLKSYGEDYKIAGQTLGEKLYEGFKSQIDAIRSLISSVTSEINAARDAAVSAAAESKKVTAIESNEGKTSNNKVTVNQTVNFNATSITPSEAARKQLQASRQLAQELGV